MKAIILKYIFTNKMLVYSNYTLKVKLFLRFYKVAFQSTGRQLLEFEFSNYQYILSQTEFKKYIPKVGITRLGPVTLLSMPNMKKMFDAKRLKEIFSDILQNSTAVRLDHYIEDKGHQFLNEWQRSLLLNQFKNLLEYEIQIGLIHGDLHKNNIMLDNGHNLKFIDLDYCEKKEFIFFDLINIFFSERIFTYGEEWKTTLFNLYRNLDFGYLNDYWLALNDQEKSLYLYLYAFKRNHNEMNKMTETEWNDLIECINKLYESK